MAVIDIKEGYTGSDAGGDDNQRRCTRVFTVLCDTVGDGPLFTWPLTDGVVTIPAPNTAHPSASSYRSGIPQVTVKGPKYYEVKVPYKTPDPRTGGGVPVSYYDDPLAAPADISWDDATRVEPVDQDKAGDPYVNSVGQPYEGVTEEYSDAVLIIERNEATFVNGTKDAYQDTVCTASFYGYAAGTARMVKIKGQRVNAVTPYWRVRYEIHFRVRCPAGVAAQYAWYRRLLNQGTEYLGTDGKYYQTPSGKMVLLATDDKISATAVWNKFQRFKASATDPTWAALGLE